MLIHQFNLLRKRTTLFILLACVPVQGAKGGIKTAAETAAIGFLTYSTLNAASYYVTMPSQVVCEQMVGYAKLVIEHDAGTAEFFEKFARCHRKYGDKIYGEKTSTLKHTDEKK